MAIRMNEVVLHQHLEEGSRSQPSDCLAKGVILLLIVCHRHAFYESLYQHGVHRVLLEGQWEVHVLVVFEHFVEFIKVAHLEGEI
jgi:hypothetical protein